MLCIFYHNFLKWMNQSQKQFYQSCRKVNKWQVILYMMCVLVTQSHLILCDPMDCSPPGSSVHGIPQARILEWVAISFSTIHDTCSKLQTMTLSLVAIPFPTPDLISPQDQASGGRASAWTTHVHRGLSEPLGSTRFTLRNWPTCDLQEVSYFCISVEIYM